MNTSSSSQQRHWRCSPSSWYTFVATVCAVFLVAASWSATQATACETDDHCRPASCCHSTMCVDITKAPTPNCTDVLCTAGCEHDTLDCGGECMCSVSKVCLPHIRAGMPPDGAGDWGVPRPQTPSRTGVRRVIIRKRG